MVDVGNDFGIVVDIVDTIKDFVIKLFTPYMLLISMQVGTPQPDFQR